MVYLVRAVVLVAALLSVAALVWFVLRGSLAPDVRGQMVAVALREAGVVSSSESLDTFDGTTPEGTALLADVNSRLDGIRVFRLELDGDRVVAHSTFSSLYLRNNEASCIVTTVTPEGAESAQGWVDLPDGGVCLTGPFSR